MMVRIRVRVTQWIAPASLRRASLRRADLSGADLSGADLSGVSGAKLSDADLRFAKLRGAHLDGANLSGANLSGANLSGADLRGATLRGANLSGADLSGADLYLASLRGADLTGARLGLFRLPTWRFIGTVFADVDLTNVVGLETCIHRGPSVIDYRTLKKSGPLPLPFLRGVGLPDNLIDYLPSLLHRAIQYYSCFISYSTKDDNFAKRIHADLQNSGVRCWFAPHDLRIGDKILDEIDAAIRLRDKVVLILSEHSIKSDWVEDEVTAGFEEERRRGEEVLFPIRLDDTVLKTNEAWAAKLRARLIGDFTRWKDHDVYKQKFDRVLRDLTNEQQVAPSANDANER
jgi:uncharacterized protein YjbI with pentapeptide repeats